MATTVAMSKEEEGVEEAVERHAVPRGASGGGSRSAGGGGNGGGGGPEGGNGGAGTDDVCDVTADAACVASLGPPADWCTRVCVARYTGHGGMGGGGGGGGGAATPAASSSPDACKHPLTPPSRRQQQQQQQQQQQRPPPPPQPSRAQADDGGGADGGLPPCGGGSRRRDNGGGGVGDKSRHVEAVRPVRARSNHKTHTRGDGSGHATDSRSRTHHHHHPDKHSSSHRHDKQNSQHHNGGSHRSSRSSSSSSSSSNGSGGSSSSSSRTAAAAERDLCVICLGALDEQTPVLTTRCGHVLHVQCMQDYVRVRRDACPLCRCSPALPDMRVAAVVHDNLYTVTLTLTETEAQCACVRVCVGALLTHDGAYDNATNIAALRIVSVPVSRR